MKLVSAIAAALSAIVFRLMMYETNLTELSGWSSSPPYSCPTCSIITRAKQNWIRNYDSFWFTKVYDFTSSNTLVVCVCGRGPHWQGCIPHPSRRDLLLCSLNFGAGARSTNPFIWRGIMRGASLLRPTFPPLHP